MAYTLLDAAYAMYYPEAEFAEGKTGVLRRIGRGAKAGVLRGGRMAKRAGKAALRNKGKLALGAGGLALAGLALSRRGKGGNIPPSRPIGLLAPGQPGAYRQGKGVSR